MIVVLRRRGLCSESHIKRRIFIKKLEKSTKKQPIRLNVTIRRTLGQDIDASCGQLRKKYNDIQKSQ